MSWYFAFFKSKLKNNRIKRKLSYYSLLTVFLFNFYIVKILRRVYILSRFNQREKWCIFHWCNFLDICILLKIKKINK